MTFKANYEYGMYIAEMLSKNKAPLIILVFTKDLHLSESGYKERLSNEGASKGFGGRVCEFELSFADWIIWYK